MPSFVYSSSVLCGLLNVNALPTVRHWDYEDKSSVDKEEKRKGMSLLCVVVCFVMTILSFRTLCPQYHCDYHNHYYDDMFL